MYVRSLEFQKSNVTLKTYQGEKIKTLGKVNLKCRLHNIHKTIEFQVYDGKGSPILGLQTLDELNIIKRD